VVITMAPSRISLFVSLLGVGLALATSAAAQPSRAGSEPAVTPSASATAAPTPQLHHAPVAVAPAGEPLVIPATILHPQLIRRALLVFRNESSKRYREVPFLRSEGEGYAATLPEDQVIAPSLEYTIELELAQGRRVAVFGSRSAPHRVQVPDNGMDLIEQALSRRVDGRRSVFGAGSEYVSFGTSVADVRTAAGTTEHTEVDDWYLRFEGGYRYRPLRVVSEFGINVGVVRGHAPVPVRKLQPGQSEAERFDVGLNYAAPWIRFRMHDLAYFDARFLVNVTEVGFSVGSGATLRIGDPFASQLALGFETIQTFGTRFFTQLDIQAHDRVRISPIVEVTNMPSAEEFGVRLLGEVGVDIGWGFAATARGGYQARRSTSGGSALGGALSYAF
jgi:hypothetical protein